MLQRLRTTPPRYGLVAVVVLFLVGLPTVIDSFQTGEWAQALILAIAIMGLNILVGYSGQLSLGHGAFMALGAYTSAILAHRYKMDYLVTIPIAGLVTGTVGFLFGIPALRLSALYLALATFALAVGSLVGSASLLPGGIGAAEGTLAAVLDVVAGQPREVAASATLLVSSFGTAAVKPGYALIPLLADEGVERAEAACPGRRPATSGPTRHGTPTCAGGTTRRRRGAGRRS